LAWYAAHHRKLPWRGTPTPYEVLLSELMLQQTRVETVIPYYERFRARWPTLSDLAAADEGDVLAAWAGLGYYRRARSLLAAARAADALGGLPATPEALAELPGVGPYTAGAVASIAFGVPAAAVDGNVERVLSRVEGLTEDPASKAGRTALRSYAQALSAPGVAGDVTQALMELGATVCSPRAPACERCPWGDDCAARASGDPTSLPRKAPRTPPVAAWAVAAIVRDAQGRVLLGRRPPGLLGGLWEPPLVEVASPPDPSDALAVSALEAGILRRAGVAVRVGAYAGEVVHVFTHRRLTARVWFADAEGHVDLSPPGVADGYEALAWCNVGGDAEKGRSRLADKLLAFAEEAASPATSSRSRRTR
jgi:A/G-specific adenine glycosylase